MSAEDLENLDPGGIGSAGGADSAASPDNPGAGRAKDNERAPRPEAEGYRPENGRQGAGRSGSGHTETGEVKSGQSESGDTESGDTASSGAGAGPSAGAESGETETGDTASGDTESGESTSGDTESDPAGASEEGDEPVAESPLAEAMATIASLEDQLKRAQAALYNTEQEYANYVRRTKGEYAQHREAGVVKVLEAMLPVLDDIQLAREHEDLDSSATALIAEKTETVLMTAFKVERFGAVGDAFDPEIHEALMHQTSDDVTEERIATLIQPGYRTEEKLLRPARVAVVSPR